MAVWVIFASKYGSTREIADVIAGELGPGITMPRSRMRPTFEPFDEPGAVILGSAIYAGRRLTGRGMVERRSPGLHCPRAW